MLPKRDLNFYRNLKIKLFKQLEKEIKAYLEITTFIHIAIDKELRKTKIIEPNQQINVLDLAKSHVLIDRSALIESVNLLDASINHALHDFQLYKLNKEREKIIKYSQVEKGLNECLKNILLSKKFENKHTLIKHFRVLRNQFSHMTMGVFYISAEQENFESFLKKLEGIEINDSWWILINGKAGVAIPFEITSSKFLEKFLEESLLFFAMLLELFFSEEDKKTKKPFWGTE